VWRCADLRDDPALGEESVELRSVRGTAAASAESRANAELSNHHLSLADGRQQRGFDSGEQFVGVREAPIIRRSPGA
jgi:hypothetical protein